MGGSRRRFAPHPMFPWLRPCWLHLLSFLLCIYIYVLMYIVTERVLLNYRQASSAGVSIKLLRRQLR